MVAVLAVYIFGAQTIRGNIADSAITAKSKTLESSSDLSKILTIQNQLSKLPAQYDNKLITSRMFVLLSSIVPHGSDVQFSSVTFNSNDGTIMLEGQSASGYSTVETLKKMIDMANIVYTSDNQKQTDKLATNVVVSNTSYGQDDSGNEVLRFTLNFNYDANLFASSSENESINIGKTGNVTDSYLGLPTSLFTDRANDEESK